MQSVEEFLAYAINLEREAADRFGQLADVMETCGNHQVGKLFRKLSQYSRLHLGDAQARAGFRDLPDMKVDDFVWPGHGKFGNSSDLGGRSLHRARH